ncbi:MAG: long-chain fatty acid--CoA ligase, partial [Proteobacteria bacterium]|nr:long-chain fatty acid--CoA ligase [Pseudomonadota bacterium]
VDEDNVIWITGRVKEQYKLENGKYVVPTALEEKINTVPNISISVIFGSGKPYNVALLVPSPEFVEKFRAVNHLEKLSDAELASNEMFRKALSKDLQAACADFRGYEKPQKFAVILDEFTIQNGLLSPALKIRRREIEKRYADIIADLYK